MKTGDTSFVAENFATEGPQGAAQPSIEDSAHAIAADRTGPMGTMEATNDIDTQGYWTVDDYEALLGLAAYRYVAAALGNATESRLGHGAVRQPPRGDQHGARPDHQPQRPRLPALLAAPAQHRQPLRQPERRQLDLAPGLRQLGLGGVPPRRPGQRPRPDHDRRHLRLRLRPPARHPPAGHDRRLPRRLLLERLQRSDRHGRPGRHGPPGPGDRGLRVHDRQQPERAAVVVGELERARPELTVGGPAPRQRAGVVAARLGHGRRQQGPARLARRRPRPAARSSSAAASRRLGCAAARRSRSPTSPPRPAGAPASPSPAAAVRSP